MTERYRIALQEDLSLVEEADGNISLRGKERQVALKLGSSAVREALKRLVGKGATLDELTGHVGPADQPQLVYYVERLMSLGLVTYTYVRDEHMLATLVPSAPGHPSRPGVAVVDVRYVLSPFVVFRAEKNVFLVESPVGVGHLVLHDPRAAVLCMAFSSPRTMAEAAQFVPLLDLVEVQDLAGLMLGISALSADEPGSLQAWSAHDLWFHMRSRQGRHIAPYGATFRLRHEMAAPAAIKPRMEGPTTSLFRPDLEALLKNDKPFTHVLETRRSFKRWGTQPMSVQELGEWLYRSARIRGVIEQDAQHVYSVTSRPHPGAGAIHPLELYVVVHDCAGLSAGLYHYRPREHELTQISGQTSKTDALLNGARGAMGASDKPPILVIMAARILRMTWKYSSMAYAAILKDVGVLFQNFYLVATAMNLASCALGGGDSELFAAASGLDPLIEPSVGEFVLGSRPDENEAAEKPNNEQ